MYSSNSSEHRPNSATTEWLSVIVAEVGAVFHGSAIVVTVMAVSVLL